ncbi:spore coat protein [Paenibacillus tritici]|jgi:similar to spore coat protein|uniref:spore coat protein n=1 Tax=Paenibacillus tritici TaxID=1873425 RepID=UPI001BA8962C|nr:spore coat protein [Paenibacillus tritici]QUL52157.1 spore coat protein [Paenibacillus tritici]
MAKELALHEQLEVHELLTLKTSCATKAVTMLELVKDDKLKALIEDDLKNSSKAIEELTSLLK